MVVYRQAVLADIPALAKLRQPGEGGGTSEDRMRRYLAGKHHPREALLPRVMWIAMEQESPIGYAAGHLTRRLDCDGELQWIYVVPERRGSEVAAKLLHLIATWFVRENARRVCVDPGNEKARLFYRRHGAVDLNKHWMVWNDVSEILE